MQNHRAYDARRMARQAQLFCGTRGAARKRGGAACDHDPAPSPFRWRPPGVLVTTVVHSLADARILHWQVRSLLEAGHAVTYAAPFFEDCGVTPWPEVTAVNLPGAVGRSIEHGA